MAYPFRDIEKKWQRYWADNKTFRAENKSGKEKFYALDMFPYPSGAGLHVGHPLGYIASDIVARYKRLKGYNVLHPMGYDSFGLPAEQYAIQTGQHPEKTTKENIVRYRSQMDKIGFSFDWEREVQTSDPKFYKWTQWIFLKLFNSWYNSETDKAEPIETLIKKFENGNLKLEIDEKKNWNEFNEKEKSDVLMNYRLAYLSESWVNWCPQLGTVLANEEVKDGVSERGGYPIERKLMPQWSLRITAYAERLLNDLEKIDWSESLKESQRNWIGKSEGSSLRFQIAPSPSGEDRLAPIGASGGEAIEVFTTRPDTTFGVTFLTIAPENELVPFLTTAEQKQKVEAYIHYAKNRSERDRQAEVKKVTGEFTGSYALHPFTGEKLPIWIAEYVLSGYGTGAVMGVPAHDTRDFAFAKHFGLQIKKVIHPNSPLPVGEGQGGEVTSLPNGEGQGGAFDTYDGYCINSDFINGLQVKDAIKKIISEIEKRGLGKEKIQYRLHDAIFGRQRYWGEPIPIYYENGIPKPVDENDLPILLPEVDKYLPTETGEPPLARAKNWFYIHGKGICSPSLPNGEGRGGALELTTMPGWAGSSWYYLRYMDAKNEKEFVSKDAVNYWQNIDLYIGGSEHATGHLLYVRFWTKFLHDLGYLPFDEPAKKLINQGMIQGVSAYVYMLQIPKRLNSPLGIYFPQICVSSNLVEKIIKTRSKTEITQLLQQLNPEKDFKDFDFDFSENSESGFYKIPIHINRVNGNDEIDFDELAASDPRFKNAKPIKEQGNFFVAREIEKMSKSKYNVVCPDDTIDEFTGKKIPGVIEQYGADTLRLYEMFLGPLEMSKPWNTNGISGVFNFLNRFWRLAHPPTPSSEGVRMRTPPRVADQREGENSLPFGEGWGGAFSVSDEEPTNPELKILHKTIKKVQQDIENYSFNTSVSAFMICVNELTELKCNKRKILEPLVILLSPFAPHIAEELWEKLGHNESVSFAVFPEYDESLTADDTFAYPVSFNGKMRFNIELSLSLTPAEIEKEVLAFEQTKKYLGEKQPKKVIVVHKRIVNIVI